MARATADLPLPDNPPIAMRRGAREHQEILREREVGARLLAHGVGPAGRREGRAQQLDLGPHRRPHGEEQRQRRKS